MSEDDEIMDLAMIMTASERHDTNAYKAKNRVESLLKTDTHERKYYKALITNYAHQIIELWCLIDYAKNEVYLKDKIIQWKSKLSELLSNAAILKIQEDNSLKNRKDAVAEVWNVEDFSNDTNAIDLRIFGKFEKENLNTNCPIYRQVLQNCLNASSDIIDVIASENKGLIEQYVYGL